MDAPASDDTLLFEGFRLDRRRGCLLNQDEDGSWRPVALGSRALDVLAILVERQGALLSKDEIMAAAWPGIVVEDNNLAVQISALRRILDRGRTDGSCIQTVPGRGYRFMAPVTQCEAETPATRAAFAHQGDDARAILDARAIGFGVSGLPEQTSAPPTRRNHHFRRGAIAALISFLLLLVGAAGWYLHFPGSIDIHPPPRLSIVVLPFASLSNDPDQQYFADGITEDLTTDLSRIADMLVISRDSAFTYKDKPVNAKQIGRELGVRYVLEGSVQRSGNQVRVNAQLIDAEADAHLWAERFDRDMGDLLALQNEITGRIANTLNLELIAAEAARPIERPDTLDYIFRGRALYFGKSPSRESYAEAVSLFEHALALDPKSVEAQTRLADALVDRVLDGESTSAAADIERANGLVGQALAASPRSLFAHHVKGNVLRAQNRYEEAIPEYETVLASNPNAVGALGNIGQCKFFTGSIEEPLPLVERAIRLSPRDPYIYFWYLQIGRARLLQSRTDEAILWLEKARSANPAHPPTHAFLASAYALKGESERAATELAEARRLSGDDRYSSIAHLQAVGYFGVPKVRALFEATYFVGLRKAGMPEN